MITHKPRWEHPSTWKTIISINIAFSTLLALVIILAEGRGLPTVAVLIVLHIYAVMWAKYEFKRHVKLFGIGFLKPKSTITIDSSGVEQQQQQQQQP